MHFSIKWYQHLIKFIILPEHVQTQADFLVILRRNMPVQSAVDRAEKPNDQKGQQDEKSPKYRVGYKRIESFIGKVTCVIQRISTLLPGRKRREKTSAVA